MAITQQRAEELAADYAKLKEAVGEVEHKYSLVAYEVDLGFPPDLGLQKLEFIPKTEEEIAALTTLSVQQKCATKQASIEKSFDDARAALLQKQLAADESHRQKTAQLVSDYSKECEAALHKAANANLLYSSIYVNALQKLLEKHNSELKEQTARYEAQNEAFSQKAEADKLNYERQTALLDEQRASLYKTVEQSLREKDLKQALAVEKYNNNVDEKEAKYQFSCKRATEYARQAERDRALAATRIYNELGESGLELRKKTEKYQVVRQKFYEYRKEEAKFVLSLDNFLQKELADYYNTLVNWVEEYLY
ncbi:MAG: hypothetical protein NC132_04560 [Corallococcus sp.]|nr:hypothetical protein [Corallococcus sp.]MCM1359658.1 hypothetical protein [Corallococcus sp.]MCM1395367.1 hypothetical protein [Corallococcus sp.]